MGLEVGPLAHRTRSALSLQASNNATGEVVPTAVRLVRPAAAPASQRRSIAAAPPQSHAPDLGSGGPAAVERRDGSSPSAPFNSLADA